MRAFVYKYKDPHAGGPNEDLAPGAGLSTHMSYCGGSFAYLSSHSLSAALFPLGWPIQAGGGRMSLPAHLLSGVFKYELRLIVQTLKYRG